MAEMAKEKQIKRELRRLVALFKPLPENELEFIMPQLENAAFMKVTLDLLQASINENGTHDEYCNGANQFGKKASADLQAYNSTVKNYNNLMKELRDKLPKEQKQSKLTELMNNE